ncbi:hypothetical protein WDJ51_03625 [Rathayibacter sp. YIM 133350]|uniref:DoxX family protein n=1 Tax=Rathayibacter sp. YIM 133350 TaxID=3131992 RepID=UPI00307EE4BA
MTGVETARTIVAVVLAIAFAAMSVLHFVPSTARGMAAIIPPAMKGTGLLSGRSLVRLTGLCEAAGAVGLLVPVLRTPAAIALCLFLVAVFPANAYAAAHPERFGRIAVPLIPRALGQLALIGLLVFVAL